MRVVARQPRRQRHSLAGVAALVLAGICLTHMHLLLRPGSRHKADVESCSDDAVKLAEATQPQAQGQGQQSQQQTKQPIRSPSRMRCPEEAAAASLSLLHGAQLAFVSFANGAFTDFIENWVLSVQRLGLPFAVGALDDTMVQMAASKGWPHLRVGAPGAGSGPGAGNTFFRDNFTAFRSMGATKVQLVLTMLEELDVGTVVVSDSDTTWLRDPTGYLEQFPTADWFVSTDCLSHELEAAWVPQHNQPRCGHIKDNGWGRAYNTGIFAVRNREMGKATLRHWRDKLLDSEHTTHTVIEHATGLKRDMGITDQVAFTQLVAVNGLMPAMEDNPRVLLLPVNKMNSTLRLHPLPVGLFPGGHVAFVQRTPWKHGFEPYVVHATFQRYSANLQRLGKRGRFREFGMWFLDDITPEYYSPSGGGHYLTYTNDVRAVIDRVEATRFNGGMPVLYKHMVAVNYQLALFKEALASATMLNRTVVLPQSWCWCDYDWVPHVLEKCTIRGSDLKLPFECPSDFIFVIPFFDNHHINYRMPGFLENPRVPDAVRRWRVELQVKRERPVRLAAAHVGAAAEGGPQAAAGAGQVAALWPHMTQAELLAAVHPFHATAVLSFNGLRPGLLAGFADSSEAKAFEERWSAITAQQSFWCCAAELSVYSRFEYTMPGPLGGLAGSHWEAPTLELPTWCDEIAASALQREFVLYANHPCQFLTNATAAAEAAALA